MMSYLPEATNQIERTSFSSSSCVSWKRLKSITAPPDFGHIETQFSN